MRFAPRTLVAVLVLAVAAPLAATPPYAASASPASAAAAVTDPFYGPPKGWRKKAPGTILRSRKAQLSAFSLMTERPAWQLLYRSTDLRGRPMATVTTVIAPSGPTRGILSYQIATDASDPRCAPSHQLTEYADPLSSANLAQDDINMMGALARGLVVSVPDYEGPRGEFGAPRQPGRAILDGIRAAERFAPLHLDVSSPAVMWGYSGGSLASGWGAQQQATYAPELNLKGAALGGFVNVMRANLLAINNTVSGGLIASGLPGMLRSSPRLARAFDKVLNPAGRAMLATGDRQCAVANIASFLGLNMDNYLTVPFAQLMQQRAVVKGLKAMDLGRVAPKMPLLVYHAVNDQVIPIASTEAAVASYCDRRTPVTYVRDLTAEHVTLNLLGSNTALDWLMNRVRGKATSPKCTTTTVLTMALTKARPSGRSALP